MKHTFSAISLDTCLLKKTRIDIWQYPLHAVFDGAQSLLTPEELTRAYRYYFTRHQRRFIVARAMLRLIISHYLPLTPIELIFTENQYGKPFLHQDPLFQFNLSHSEDLALLAIGYEYPVGVDLEFFGARPYLGIGQQMFSPQENDALARVPPYLKPLAFFHIWSQKEALIKACGLGLSYPTQDFDVIALPSANDRIVDQLHHTNWHMVSFMPLINCCAALCHHPTITEVRYLTLNEAGFLKP